LQARQRHHRQQVSDMQARSGRIEPDVRRHAFCGQELREPFRHVVHHPPPGQFIEQRGHRSQRITITGMPVTRRAVLKTLMTATAGAVTAAGTYGFTYGRHALEVTRSVVPVDGLPPALSGLRIGLLTDIHRSRWVSDDDVAEAVAALMGEHPDMIVLGGDYVTWGDRHYVAASASARLQRRSFQWYRASDDASARPCSSAVASAPCTCRSGSTARRRWRS